MPTDFDAVARTWDTPERSDRAHRLCAAMVGAVPVLPTWRAADVGCGTGQLGRALIAHVAHVILVDTSAGMLAVAAEQTDDAERFSILNHDLSDAPLPHPVDLLVSAMALHHVPDTAAFLTHARASLIAGGWIALADLDADPDNHFHDDDFDGRRGIDRHALVLSLRDLGFVDVAEQTATTVVKPKDGVDHTHELFLVTGRLP